MSLVLIVSLFGIAVGTQIIFFLFLFKAFVSKRKPGNSDQHLPVSVIVCAHDEEENLRELLPLLLKQEYGEFEVIVVDDRSNDDTYDFLLAETNKDQRLKIVKINQTPEKMNSKKYAITLGIRSAKNELILLTDADSRPASTQWISKMASGFDESTDIMLGYSPYYKSGGFLNSFIRFETLLTGIQYLGFAMLGMPYMGVGRNLAYRKSLFLNNKGFADYVGITGGDDDLFVNRHARKSNTRVCIDREAIVHSIPKKSWDSFFRQKVRHLSVGRHYKTTHKLMIGIFHGTYVLSWILGVLIFSIFPDMYWVAIALLLRSIIVIATAVAMTRQSKGEISAIQVLFLDFVYAIYYISTGLKAFLTKKVQWTS